MSAARTDDNTTPWPATVPTATFGTSPPPDATSTTWPSSSDTRNRLSSAIFCATSSRVSVIATHAGIDDLLRDGTQLQVNVWRISSSEVNCAAKIFRGSFAIRPR